MTDPVDLTAALIRCPSVTPEEGGAIDAPRRMLAAAGFRTAAPTATASPTSTPAGARAGPVLGFNGHTDVVPAGRPRRLAPRSLRRRSSRTAGSTGRGAADMKSGVAAFVAAAIDFVAATPPAGSVVLAITGDEEGDERRRHRGDPRLDGRERRAHRPLPRSASRPARAAWAR